MGPTIRWGILGLGAIAHAFAEGLKSVPGAQLVACGSRTAEKASEFAKKWGIPRAHASYEALAADPGVDAVYIATPHPLHRDNTILCLDAGKAVLCEKPFAMNAAETKAMIAAARKRKVFLMEALWSRFLPHVIAARDLIAAGRIGEVRMLQADFGFRCDGNTASRILDPHLGGGALLDVGIYVVSLSSLLLGPAREIKALAHLGKTGVDEQAAVILSHDAGRLSVLSTAVRTRTPMEATILGTEGWIRLHSPWWRASKLTLSVGDAQEEIAPPHEGNGYNYEAIEVGNCLRAGRLESAALPLEETLEIMKTLDSIRSQWGLKYPME